MVNTASEHNEPHAIGWIETWFFYLPVKDAKLPAKQGVFSEQLGFATGWVGNRGKCIRGKNWSREVEEGLFENRGRRHDRSGVDSVGSVIICVPLYLRLALTGVLRQFGVASRFRITQRAWVEVVPAQAIETRGAPDESGTALNSNLALLTGTGSLKPYVERAPSTWQ